MIPDHLKDCEPLTEEEVKNLLQEPTHSWLRGEGNALIADWYRYQELLHIAKYTYRQFCSLQDWDIIKDLKHILEDLGVDTDFLSKHRIKELQIDKSLTETEKENETFEGIKECWIAYLNTDHPGINDGQIQVLINEVERLRECASSLKEELTDVIATRNELLKKKFRDWEPLEKEAAKLHQENENLRAKIQYDKDWTEKLDNAKLRADLERLRGAAEKVVRRLNGETRSQDDVSAVVALEQALAETEGE